jgi:hypothetical protein
MGIYHLVLLLSLLDDKGKPALDAEAKPIESKHAAVYNAWQVWSTADERGVGVLKDN